MASYLLTKLLIDIDSRLGQGGGPEYSTHEVKIRRTGSEGCMDIVNEQFRCWTFTP